MSVRIVMWITDIGCDLLFIDAVRVGLLSDRLDSCGGCVEEVL
jgi:hypothetical protein